VRLDDWFSRLVSYASSPPRATILLLGPGSRRQFVDHRISIRQPSAARELPNPERTRGRFTASSAKSAGNSWSVSRRGSE
jgi:hypothetical protein